MPKITLENGTSLEISQESYNEFRKAASKDWRDAFIEHGDSEDMVKVEHSCTDAINIVRCGDCTEQRLLMKYVLSFPNGGFWYSDKVLYFVTKGITSHPDATYQHARKFIENGGN